MRNEYTLLLTSNFHGNDRKRVRFQSIRSCFLGFICCEIKWISIWLILSFRYCVGSYLFLRIYRPSFRKEFFLPLIMEGYNFPTLFQNDFDLLIISFFSLSLTMLSIENVYRYIMCFAKFRYHRNKTRIYDYVGKRWNLSENVCRNYSTFIANIHLVK